MGIKALIINNGKILLLSSGASELSSTKRSRVFWDLPGGKAEWGEGITETLKREVQEELGVPAKSLKVKGIFEASVSRIRTSHGITVPLILIIFLCSLSNSRARFRLTDEHASYRWVGIGTAKKLLNAKFNSSFIKELSKLG